MSTNTELTRWIVGGKVLRRTDGMWTLQEVDVKLEGNRIAELIPPDSRIPSVTDLDAHRRIVIPGLINAHIHSNDNFRRGMFDNIPLELYGLLKTPIGGAAPLSIEAIRACTLLGAMECLLTGTTTVVDDVWHENNLTAENIDTIMDSYNQLGMRAWVTANLGDRSPTETDPFLVEFLTREQYADLDNFRYDTERALAISEDALRRYNSPESDGLVRFAMGASGPQQCTDAFLQDIWELARRWQVPVVSHVLETRVQAITARISYDMTLVERLDELECLDSLTHIVHGIWLTPSDIELLATRNSSVIHNPISNLRLGSGVSPIPDLLDKGVNVALGTDGTCTNDNQNLFLEMRLAGCLHAAIGPDHARWVQANDAFEMATLRGAAALGQEGALGEIEPGFKADLVLLDENSTAFVPINDPVRNLVFAEHGQSVRTVLVNGEIVVEDGRLTRVDQEAVWEEAREYARQFFAHNEDGYRRMRALVPAFEKAYIKAQKHDWSPSRYIYG